MKKRRINLFLTLGVILLLMVLVIIYTTRLFYRISVANLVESGEEKAARLTVQLESYLDTAKSILWVTGDTVDNMIKNNDPSDRILQFLLDESKNQEEQFDENYTGIYGYIRGEYLDGVGWEPPEGYVPTERDWYIISREAGGKCVIVPPYVDAQTGAVIISVSRMLSDGESVISLDITLNHIQSIIEDVSVKDKGFGMVIDAEGMIVAHRDSTYRGKYYNEIGLDKEFLNTLSAGEDENFQAVMDGEKTTFFYGQLMEQWYAVIAVNNKELYREVWSQLFVNILVYMISFFIICMVCIYSYRKEWKYSKKVEELIISEQKQEYEAKVLRLEKASADAANKAKGDFLAEMSHEIRTPINAVLGMNEMILRESEDPAILKYSGNIESAGRNLLSIINDILDFSKIEDGKMEIIPVRYDLVTLISNLENAITERANAKKLNLEFIVDGNLPVGLLGDDVRITQVISNLLTNAVKYTEKGKVTFEIKDGGREESEVFLDVSVTDTGIGIREEDMQKLFESFERLEEKRNRHIEGTGLGMSIVTKLLSLMGSEIKVKSEYGKGSVFYFRLKQTIVNDEPVGDYAERVNRNRSARKEAAYLYAPAARVLVVDDNGMNLEVAKNLMKRDGIMPDTAASGEEAIEKMRRHKYNIVFLDHMMPKMDGIETLEKLNEENLIPEDTVVIALTANAVVGARERYLEAGFKDYLSKPIDSALLEKKLKEYLPAELVSFISSVTENEDESADSDDSFAGKLKKLGINTESGLKYCADDESFYEDIIGDYADSCDEKIDELTRYFDHEDWKNYQILIHSVKTTSKTIGADDISEKARNLEMSLKEDKPAYVLSNHDGFCADFKKICDEINKIRQQM